MDRVTQNNAKLASETAQTLVVLHGQSSEVRKASEDLSTIVGHKQTNDSSSNAA